MNHADLDAHTMLADGGFRSVEHTPAPTYPLPVGPWGAPCYGARLSFPIDIRVVVAVRAFKVATVIGLASGAVGIVAMICLGAP